MAEVDRIYLEDCKPTTPEKPKPPTRPEPPEVVPPEPTERPDVVTFLVEIDDWEAELTLDTSREGVFHVLDGRARYTYTVDPDVVLIIFSPKMSQRVKVNELLLPHGHQAVFAAWWGVENSPLDERFDDKLEAIDYPTEIFGTDIYCGLPFDDGDSGGGDYISPRRYQWRGSDMGRQRAIEEMVFVWNRQALSFHDNEGHFTPSEGIALKHGFDRPEGWEYDANAYLAAGGDMDYIGLHNFDGQHLIRGYEAGLALMDTHAGEWFLKCFGNWVRLAWGPGTGRNVANRLFWGIDQWIERILNTGKIDCCGREFAHVARFVWACGPGSEFSAQLEEAVRLSSAIDPLCYGNRGNYSNKARVKAGGPYPNDALLCMSREPFLLYEAMLLRPGLHEEAANLMLALGPYPAETINLDERLQMRNAPHVGRVGYTAHTGADTPGSKPYQLFFGVGDRDKIRAQVEQAPADVVHQPLDHMSAELYTELYGE